MAQASPLRVIYNALAEHSKSVSKKGKPICKNGHLLKKGNVIEFYYDGPDKYGVTGKRSTIFTFTKGLKWTFLPGNAFHGSSEVYGHRMSEIIRVINNALKKAGLPIEMSGYTGIQFRVDHGIQPTQDFIDRFEKRFEAKEIYWGYDIGYNTARVTPKQKAEKMQQEWAYQYRWETVENLYLFGYGVRKTETTLSPGSDWGPWQVKMEQAKPDEQNGLIPLRKRKNEKFYKIMKLDGRTGYAHFNWDMPKSNNGGDQIPGDWHEACQKDGELRMCSTGIHVCDLDNMENWLSAGSHLVEMEVEGKVYGQRGDNKYLCRKARVVKVIGPLGDSFHDLYIKCGRSYPAAFKALIKGVKPPKRYTVTARRDVVITEQQAQTFSAFSLKEAKRQARNWAQDDSGYGNRRVKNIRYERENGDG